MHDFAARTTAKIRCLIPLKWQAAQHGSIFVSFSLYQDVNFSLFSNVKQLTSHLWTGYFRLASGDTIALEMTNEPTPASINPVPKVSAFPNLLGKALKSTAKIIIAVPTRTQALKFVMNGLFPVTTKFNTLFRRRPELSSYDALLLWNANKATTSNVSTK